MFMNDNPAVFGILLLTIGAHPSPSFFLISAGTGHGNDYSPPPKGLAATSISLMMKCGLVSPPLGAGASNHMPARFRWCYTHNAISRNLPVYDGFGISVLSSLPE